MALSIRIIDSPKGENVTKWNIVFPEDGGSIGRKTGSTLQLNDASRIISSVHAQITKCESGYRITDVSTNGLYVNRSSAPLGKSKSIVISDGDVLGIGGYVLLVSIDSIGKPSKQEKPSTEEIFDPFAKTDVNDSDVVLGDQMGDLGQSANIQEGIQASGLDMFGAASATLKKDTSKKNEFDFPDPFLNIEKRNDDDPFITSNSYDYNKSRNVEVNLQPKDDILDDDFKYEIRKDPFADVAETQQNSIKPATPMPLYLDNRNMFGGNPFDSSNDLIDTPLGDISDNYSKENTFLNISIAVRKHQALMEEALSMAFNRFLQDLEPSNFEEMCSVFNTSKLFFLKPNYWNFYKKYYEVNKKNNEWQSKFFMYFKESLEIVKKRNKKKND